MDTDRGSMKNISVVLFSLCCLFVATNIAGGWWTWNSSERPSWDLPGEPSPAWPLPTWAGHKHKHTHLDRERDTERERESGQRRLQLQCLDCALPSLTLSQLRSQPSMPWAWAVFFCIFLLPLYLSLPSASLLRSIVHRGTWKYFA